MHEVYKWETVLGKGDLFLFFFLFFFSFLILKDSAPQSKREEVNRSAETLNKPHCLHVCSVKEGIYSSPLCLSSVNSRIKAGESGRGALAAGEVRLCLFARHSSLVYRGERRKKTTAGRQCGLHGLGFLPR